MKKFIKDTDSHFLKVSGDTRPFKIEDRGHIMSGCSNPNRSSSFLISSGWPVKGIWPSVRNESRYYLDPVAFSADLDVGGAMIYLGSLPTHSTELMFESKYQFTIGNFTAEWNMRHPVGKLTLGELSIEEEKESLVKSEVSDLYTHLDFGNDSIDMSAVINHYSVVNYAVERGRGHALSGYFYVDNPGDWNFAIDGQNLLEVVVGSSVVYSRYTTGAASGSQDKSGTINLTTGWKKIWAYCSYAMPSVWYERPGDIMWSSLNNSLDWTSANLSYMPNSLSFTKLGVTLRSTLSFNASNEVVLDAPIADFEGGYIELMTDTNPKAQTYYAEDWRNSNVEADFTNPPFFQNMRIFTKFHPSSETMTQNGITVSEFTPFLFSLDFINWYKWTGSVFQLVIINNVSDLKSEGNTLLEVMQIPNIEWDTFLGSEKACWLMLTGQAPIFLNSVSASLDLANNEYALVNLEKIANRVRLDKDEL